MTLISRFSKKLVTLMAMLAIVLPSLLAPSPAAGQYFGKNKVQYREFDWKIYHSQHFDIYYNQAEAHLLQKVASFAESAYDELSRRFDYQIQEPTPLIVYETHSAFQQNNIILNGVPEGAQAFATPNRFRMVMPLDMPDPDLQGLIKHELTHIFQYYVLFRGKLGAGLRGRPPTWFIEGMASYMADDETSADRKFMVDAVVNDNIPSVAWQGGGFIAYRYGHVVFDYIEERWGAEAVLDLIYEFRNTLGASVGKAIERTFRIDAEDFDAEFRRWLRKRYLATLLDTGEPGDFGRPFRLEENNSNQGWELSPAASPSGDLVAAITTDKGEVDISLFDAQNRRRLRNLTKGLEKDIRQIVTQFLTTGRGVGRDLAFSPDGNYIAAFGRRESGRSLILIDVLNGGLAKIIDMEIEQQLSPAFSPDGRYVAFSGNLDGYFDIFTVDLESLEIRNITHDEIYDAAPSYSPDGNWLTYSSWVGEYAQLFRLDPRDPSKRYQLTEGETNNKEAVYSASGRRIYFTSDRSGADNIYGLDLERGEITQYTNSVTGCDRPAVLALPEGGERLVYTGYWKGRFDLFMTDVEEPLGTPEVVDISDEPAQIATLERFEPDIEVSIDDANIDSYGGKKFFLESIDNFIGIDSNNIFVGRVVLSFSDYLGDRRFIANVAAVDTFSNFQFTYLNLKNRWQWAARVFDERFFAVRRFRDTLDGRIDTESDELFKQTGVEFRLIYPFNFNNRVEIATSVRNREYKGSLCVDLRLGGDAVSCQGALTDPDIVPVILPREDDFPELSVTLISDNTVFNQWGAIGGHRIRLSGAYAPDTEESGTLHTQLTLDARQYVPLTRRSNFAFRFFAGASDGNFAQPYWIGGLDTLRGFEFRELSGTRVFYGNAELRFPLIEQLAFAGLGGLGGIRGILFFDIGGNWYDDVQDFDFYDSTNSQLDDAVASYGWGLSARFFGFPVNWDFARVTRFGDNEESSFETEFWIGTRF